MAFLAVPPRDRHPASKAPNDEADSSMQIFPANHFVRYAGRKKTRKHAGTATWANVSAKDAYEQTRGKKSSACNGPRNRRAVLPSHRRKRGKLVGISKCTVGRFLNFQRACCFEERLRVFQRRRSSDAIITVPTRCAPRTYARIDARSCHTATLTRPPAAHVRSIAGASSPTGLLARHGGPFAWARRAVKAEAAKRRDEGAALTARARPER